VAATRPDQHVQVLNVLGYRERATAAGALKGFENMPPLAQFPGERRDATGGSRPTVKGDHRVHPTSVFLDQKISRRTVSSSNACR
jgi:hypothetical protein